MKPVKLIELDPKPKTVAELYAIPGTWTKGSMWRGERGNSCEAQDAVSACIGAAIGMIYGNNTTEPYVVMSEKQSREMNAALVRALKVAHKMAPQYPFNLIATWNDTLCGGQEEARLLAVEAGI